MRTLKLLTGIAVIAFLLGGCAKLELYTGDHGSLDFRQIDVDNNHPYAREIEHVYNHYSTFTLEVDGDPKRMFWFGAYPPVGPRTSLGVYWSSFDGARYPKYEEITGLRRLALDPVADRLLIEKVVGPELQLLALSYQDLEAGNTTALTPVVTNAVTFSKLFVDPGSRKIFWLEKSLIENTLVEFDMKTGVRTNHINSTQHPFLNAMKLFAIDVQNRHMYWSQNLTGYKDDLIGRIDYLDGSNKVDWVDNNAEYGHLVSYPYQLTIDQRSGRVYWTDMNFNWVASARLTGNNVGERDVRILDVYPPDQKSLSYHPTTLRSVYRPGQIFNGMNRGWQPVIKAGANAMTVSETGTIPVEPVPPTVLPDETEPPKFSNVGYPAPDE